MIRFSTIRITFLLTQPKERTPFTLSAPHISAKSDVELRSDNVLGGRLIDEHCLRVGIDTSSMSETSYLRAIREWVPDERTEVAVRFSISLLKSSKARNKFRRSDQLCEPK